MDVAVEEQRISAEDNAKNHSEKEDKNKEEEEDTNQSAQPKIDQGAEKRCNDKKSQEEPASEGGCAMIKKEHILLSKAEKTHVPTDVEELNDAAQTHLLVVPKDASERLQLKKTKENKRKRRELKKIKKELGSAEETRVPMDVEEPWKWHSSFSSRLLHCSKKKRVDKGFILLQAKVKRVILLGTDETLLDTYYLKEEESIHIGSVLEFPCHKVDVGEPTERGIDNENEKPPSKRNEKRKRLKKNAQPLRSPEAALLRSSIGLFARVASSRKGMSPQAKRGKSQSPSSLKLAHKKIEFTRPRPGVE